MANKGKKIISLTAGERRAISSISLKQRGKMHETIMKRRKKVKVQAKPKLRGKTK